MSAKFPSPQVVFIMSPNGTFTPTQSGALATNIWECCRAAQKEGIEPMVVSRRSEVEPYDTVRTAFVDYPPIPENRFAFKLARAQRKLTGWSQVRQKAYSMRVARALRESNVEGLPWILHNDPDLAVFLRARFPKAFILHRFHNQLSSPPRVRKRLAASVNAAACVSDFTREWIEEHYGLKGRAHTVHNGVDFERFTPADEMPSGLPIINFVGRTGIEKAPDTLLKAALKLSERTRDFGLQIVGSNYWHKFELDDYQRELRDLTEQLQARGIAVRQPGHIDRFALPDEFRRAHIHVVPSRWDEPFGLTTVEGMASGLATIASNTGGSPEIIRDAGFLFERDNVDELSEQLEQLVRDESLRRDYGKRARVRAQDFPWSNTWGGLRKIIGI